MIRILYGWMISQKLKLTTDQSLFCPICSKIFEKIIFNEIYNFLLEEGLSNPNQYGVRPGDFCINQTFEAFDCNPSLEVRLVFLYISKAFGKVCHEGLLYKIKSMGISEEPYNLV